MPFPIALTKFNKAVTNRIMGPLAGRVAPLTMVHHEGRASNRSYATPVFAFPCDGGMIMALTYGPDVDWVKNILATGRADLTYRGERRSYGAPRLVGEAEGMPLMPGWVRTVLGPAGVTDFLRLDDA